MAPAPVTASPSSSKSRQNSNNNNNLLPSLLPISSLVEKRIPADYIQVGDLLKVMPGERIPADGVIEFGATSVDEALVTGEPLPVKKQVSDSVIGGTVNGTGLIHVRAMRVGQDTTLAQIVKLVSNAQTEKAPIQYIADTIAGYFVPAVVLLAAITFLVWLVLLSCMSEHMSAWSFPVKLYPQSLVRLYERESNRGGFFSNHFLAFFQSSPAFLWRSISVLPLSLLPAHAPLVWLLRQQSWLVQALALSWEFS